MSDVEAELIHLTAALRELTLEVRRQSRELQALHRLVESRLDFQVVDFERDSEISAAAVGTPSRGNISPNHLILTPCSSWSDQLPLKPSPPLLGPPARRLRRRPLRPASPKAPSQALLLPWAGKGDGGIRPFSGPGRCRCWGWG